MAVFTTFSEAALARYLVMYDIGELVSFSPIESGIENSNYFVTLGDSDNAWDFVLTITENLSFSEVPFFNDLFHQLERAGLPVPNPTRTLDGMASTIFCGKPTWLFPKLPGAHPLTANEKQCELIGATLARIHAASATARYPRENPYDTAWIQESFASLATLLGASDVALLQATLVDYLSLVAADNLPKGIIHGDLFRDNTLFEGDELTGVIDFYHACSDYLAQDLAITLNEWCSSADGVVDKMRASAMMRGYESVRPLSEPERDALPVLQRNGAMRFILTRLQTGTDGNYLKDPEEFLRILRHLPDSSATAGSS